MNRIKKTTAFSVAAVVALVGAGAGIAFGVDNTKEVRAADFIPTLGAGSQGESDNRTKGHYEFLEEGIHVWTESNDSQSKVAEYFEPRDGNTAIPATYTQDWFGDGPRDAARPANIEPGRQIVFDTDGTRGNADSVSGNDPDYNILVGETIYGDDWWLPGGSTKATTNGFTCPSTDSGSGSDCHGTLAQWKASLATDKPAAEVYALGFSLGSGVKGDGVIRSQSVTYADAPQQDYVFTDEVDATAGGTTAPGAQEAHTSNAKPVGTGTFANQNRAAAVQLKTNALPANNRGAGKVSWLIKVQGVNRFSSTQGFGEVQNFRWTFSKKGGSKKVEILRNGVHYKTAYVTTK
jgi:hypothetical protein